MTYENDNRGAAFYRKSENPNAPLASGPCQVAGTDLEFTLWRESDEDGKPTHDVSFSPKWSKGEDSLPPLESSGPDDNRGKVYLSESDNPKAPFLSGPVKVLGTELEVSLWKNTSGKGLEYLSCKFTAKWTPSNSVDAAIPVVNMETKVEDEDIPF